MFGAPCAGCARQVRIDADACWGCGRRITAEERVAEHGRRVRRACRWIGIWAILMGASGLVTFTEQKTAADEIIGDFEVRAIVADRPMSEAKSSALRDRLARRRLSTLGVNLGLALLFATLWWWAVRAPVAALVSAIAALLGVWIVVGIIDRSTLLEGYVLRVAAFVIFCAGLRAALAARRAAAQVH
jgi:hypothetical protein